jgi:uroporphyrinogen decarboxylase
MNAFAPYAPDFTRLHKTLFAQKADRVPLLELGIDEGVMGEFLGRSIQTLADKIDFFCKAGYDYVKLSPIIDMNPAGITPEDGFRQSGATELDRSRRWGSEGKGVITANAEFDRFEFAVVKDEQFRLFEEATRILPAEMKVIGQYGDIFTFVWELMGFETFSFALVENPDLVHAMFDRIGTIIYTLFERMAQFDVVGGLFYSDDIAYQTGLMMSPHSLRQHLFPWMKKIGALCLKRQIPFLYHSDGILWEVMDDLLDAGITALQPIEPKAWDIVEVKKRFGDRLALIGNVDVDLLARGTPDAIRTEVLRLIKQVGHSGGYCVGSGNTIPNYVKLENYRAMLETTWLAGAY